MKIEENMLFFAIHLEEGEDITEMLKSISTFDKRYEPEERTWYIRNFHLDYVKKMLKIDQQCSLF